MTGGTLAVTAFGVMLALIAVRMPIGLAMLVVGSVGYLMVHPSGLVAFIAYMKTNPYHQFANYTLSVIPLFILMGALAERSGISTRPVPRGGAHDGACPRRSCHGGHLGLHGVRRHLRLVGRDHGHVRPRGTAGAAALSL